MDNGLLFTFLFFTNLLDFTDLGLFPFFGFTNLVFYEFGILRIWYFTDLVFYGFGILRILDFTDFGLFPYFWILRNLYTLHLFLGIFDNINKTHLI